MAKAPKAPHKLFFGEKRISFFTRVNGSVGQLSLVLLERPQKDGENIENVPIDKKAQNTELIFSTIESIDTTINALMVLRKRFEEAKRIEDCGYILAC